jgi:hypothetical protein
MTTAMVKRLDQLGEVGGLDRTAQCGAELSYDLGHGLTAG